MEEQKVVSGMSPTKTCKFNTYNATVIKQEFMKLTKMLIIMTCNIHSWIKTHNPEAHLLITYIKVRH